MSQLTYISGRMSNMPGHNFALFNEVARALRARGVACVNPVDINPDPGKTWRECLRADIKALVDCNAILMLDGWEESKGATLEHTIAVALGFDVHYGEKSLLEKAA